MSKKWHYVLPFVFMVVAAISRWPNFFPANFSAFYGLAFCAGAFFPKQIKWWLPIVTLFVSDLVLDIFYYKLTFIQCFGTEQLVNYVAFLAVIALGTRFNSRSSWLKLVSGGVLGAFLFYLITNTASWFFNPYGNVEYTKTLMGWIIAMTKGVGNYPSTIDFFLRTLLSGGLFTGLFAGALKIAEAGESAAEKEAPEPAEVDPEAEPAADEAKA